MRGALLGFSAGVALLQWQANLLSMGWAFGILVIALLMMAVVSRLPRPGVRVPLLTGCAVALGFAWATLFAQWYLQHELPSALEGQDVTVVGTIDSLPNSIEQGVRFHFAVERVVPRDGVTPELPPRLALSWTSGFFGQQSTPIGDVQPGERWQLTVRLARPHGNANPYGFDYEVWLLEQNLRATGYVRPDSANMPKNLRLDAFVVTPGNLVERSRAWLRDRILAALPGQRYAGVLVALVVGDQRGIAQSDWTIFTRTGIGHLISISGLHITMVAGLFALLGKALWRRSFFTRAELPLILPAQKFAALVGAGVALLYVLLAGFGVPAQRTLYMLAVVAVALWCGRLTSISYVLCTALGVVLLLDPWAVMAPGFWLSFGAVVTILYATVGRMQAAPEVTRRRRLLAAARQAGHTQYVVTIGLVPLTMLLFGQVSLISPIANAVAIPLVSFIVTPLALLGSIAPAPISGWLLGLGHFCIDVLAQWLGWMGTFSGAVWSAPIPSFWMFMAAAIGTLWLLAPHGWPARWAGFAGWLPLLVNAPLHPATGQFQVTAFDVGQGMALLIETAGHRLLYDTGPAYSPESDGANRVLIPYLKARGIPRLDAVVISHSDADHSGGALSLFDALPVDWVTTSLPLENRIVQAAKVHRRCIAGQRWNWDGVEFAMLHPTAVSYTSDKWKPNARSCTLRISVGAQSILLPGDIEATSEIELVNSIPAQLRSTVLLAPHHGSGTSSTPGFLDAVAPSLALFQVGYRNRYRHPKPEVFARYGQQGIERIRTDVAGAITLQFGDQLTWSTYRQDHARYWYGR
ncbi:DNA internalization-related competence protein ComEC/Rec2 [Actimicrobium antarcticum]|uniref:DNA internalization-related competence protein ComEC/Rec2 n=1 Tax=Actimicrobium antarcticum TaxID=1051899 RepID=A0ABP7SJ73_9BURK